MLGDRPSAIGRPADVSGGHFQGGRRAHPLSRRRLDAVGPCRSSGGSGGDAGRADEPTGLTQTFPSLVPRQDVGWRVRKGIVVEVSADARSRLEAVAADRNSPQKHVWRARIVLLTADG